MGSLVDTVSSEQVTKTLEQQINTLIQVITYMTHNYVIHDGRFSVVMCNERERFLSNYNLSYKIQPTFQLNTHTLAFVRVTTTNTCRDVIHVHVQC